MHVFLWKAIAGLPLMHAWRYSDLWFQVFVALPAGRIVISTTAVTVTVGKKTAIAGGKGHFFYFGMQLSSYSVWWLCGFYKMLQMQTINALDMICKPFAFLVPQAQCACSGQYTNLWQTPTSFTITWANLGHLDSECLCAADLVCVSCLHYAKHTNKQTYLSYTNLGGAALRCENPVIFGNEKLGEVRNCFWVYFNLTASFFSFPLFSLNLLLPSLLKKHQCHSRV